MLTDSAATARRLGERLDETTLTGFAFDQVTFSSAQGDPHAPRRGFPPHSTPHSVLCKPSQAQWRARGTPGEEIDRVMGGIFLVS